MMGLFANSSFSITVSSEKKRMIKYQKSEDHFYPTRDSCSGKSDPVGGCISSDALYFHTNISVTNEGVNVVQLLSRRDFIVTKLTFRGNQTYILNPNDLDCSYAL